jgi:AsmA-like C-terminal region
MKKFLKITAICLATFLALAVSIPYFFKDKIVAQLKTTINENLNAKVDFSDVDISLLRNFPKVNLRINDLKVIGKNEFEGVSLLDSKYFDINADFWALVSGSDIVPIKSIHLEKPVINILVLPNEKANYDITIPEDVTVQPTEPSRFKLALEKYTVADASLTYDDKALGFFMQLNGTEHQGSGELTADVFDFVTKTTAKEGTVAYGGTTYLDKVKTDAEVTVNADMKNTKFTLKDNTLKLNDFEIKGEGWTQLGEVDINSDLKFWSPQSDFKNLLSILPNAYSQDFASTQAAGKFDFKTLIKGLYNETTYPSVDFNLDIDGASFKYPSLPLGVSQIATKIAVKSPQGQDFNNMTVDIPVFNLNVGNNPVNGYFYLKTPVVDPDIDTKINGTINLADVAKAFPVKDVEGLNGLISANIVAKTKMSYIDKKMYDKVNMVGGLAVQNFFARPKDMPKIAISAMKMNFSPNFVAVENFVAQLGKSDVQASGRIDNILAYFSPKNTVKGALTLRSNYFDANEWLPKTATTTPESSAKAQAISNGEVAKNAVEKPFDRFDFALDAKINNLTYDTYNLLNTSAVGHFMSEKMTFENFATKIGESDIKLTGAVENVFDYLYENEILRGTLNVSSANMNVNQFMLPDNTAATAANTSTTATNLEPVRIPKNLELIINANMGKVTYTNMEMEKLKGHIVVSQGVAKMVETSANTLGGQIGLNGTYDSTVEKPKYEMAYDIKNFDFQQAFKTFNTFATIAPLGKYMNGRFNSTLSMKGDLGKDMMPDFNTLTANGFLHTLQAALNNVDVVQNIANTLNIKDLNPLNIKDSKNWFEVKNGALVINPFQFKVKDLNFDMAGSHSFANEMNYVIKTKVPRKLLEKNAVTAAANNGYNLILKEAAKTGLNIKNGEFVNCQFSLGGSMLSPKVTFKLLGTDGQTVEQTVENTVQAVAEKAQDSIRRRAEQEIKKIEDKARANAEKARDSINNVAKREAEKAIEKGKDAVKEQVGKIDKELGEKAGEVIGDKAGEKAKGAIEKGKGAIDKIFKKKN